MSKTVPCFETQIWEEVASEDNPFQPEQVFCHGYNVFNDLLNKANFSEYILLLFIAEKPTARQTQLFNLLTVALANAGPRDTMVRAAMNSGVGGAPAAANLISALSVGAGQFEGSREIFHLVTWFEKGGLKMSEWRSFIESPNQERVREDIWEPLEHFPGINPYSDTPCARVSALLELLGKTGDEAEWQWLNEHRKEIESLCNGVMTLNFVSACIFHVLNFTAEQAEMCHLLIRLPGAAVHALEAKGQGWRKFPFFGQQLELLDDPGKVADLPDVSEVLK